MQDAIIEGMFSYVYPEKYREKRVWRVVIIERDDMGTRVKDNPDEMIYRADLTYAEAMSVANDFNQEEINRRFENKL